MKQNTATLPVKATDSEEERAHKLGMKAATDYISKWKVNTRAQRYAKYCKDRDGEIGGRPFLHLSEIFPEVLDLCPFRKEDDEDLYEAWMGGFDFVCRGNLK